MKNKKKILIIAVAVVIALAVIISVIVALAVNSGSGANGDDTGIDDSGVGALASGDENADPENAGKAETDEKGDPVDSVNGGENADPDDSSSSDSKNNSGTPSDSTGTPMVPGISGYIPGPSIAPKDTDENDPADPSDPDDPEYDPSDPDDPEYDPSDPENIDPDDEIDYNEPLESTVVVEPGKTGADWPSSLPSAIPVFGGNIVFSNNCTYEKYQVQEVWYMGWDGTVSAYNDWMNALANAGFAAVPDVYGYYVNGEYLLDITTEEEFTRDEDGEQISTGNVWVSMDVYHASEIVYPDEIKGIMPSFDLDATLDYWNVDKKGRTVTVFYQTAGNWSADASTLSNALSSAGFSVSNGNASKSVGGVTVNVSWSDCKIVITY